MKPVILLTGKNGQVGAELLRLLPQVGEVVARGHDQLDLSNPANVRRIRKIQLIVAARNHFAHLGQETQKFCANLTVLPGQQDYRFHFPGSPGRCSVRTWVSFGYFASFSETTGTFIPQDILRSGSFQAMPCSSAGS